MKIKLTDLPVLYINLESETHKKTYMQEALSSLGFKNIIRFNATLDDSRRHGCSLSHYSAIKSMLNCEGPFIILEDDLRVRDFVDEIEIPDDSDAVYLGNSRYGLFCGMGIKQVSAEKHDELLYKIYNMLGAHAILYVNKKYATDLLKMFEFDIMIKDHHDKSRAASMKYYNVYAFDTPMFYQYWQHESVTNAKISDMELISKERSY